MEIKSLSANPYSSC